MIGSAIEATPRPTSHVSQSNYPQTPTSWTPTDAVGSAIEDIEESVTHVPRSKYLRMPSWIRAGAIGSVIEASRKPTGRAWPSSGPLSTPFLGVNQSGGRSDRWECDRGFRKNGTSCVALEIPRNAFLASSGRDWECERGFRKRGGSCVAVVMPANAHLGYSGNDWRCDAGYRRQGEACIAEKG